MRKMIIIFTTLTIFVFTITSPCLASKEDGELLGEARATDIVVYLDGLQIPSFNFEDHMYVFVDDFKQYGFDVDWDENWVDVDFNKETPVGKIENMQTQKPANGQPIGEVYKGKPNLTFNASGFYYLSLMEFKGRIAVPIYGLITESYNKILAEKEFGQYVNYNHYLLSINWHPESRTVTIDTLREGTKIKTDMGIVTFDSYKQIGYLGIREWFIDNRGIKIKYNVKNYDPTSPLVKQGWLIKKKVIKRNIM